MVVPKETGHLFLNFVVSLVFFLTGQQMQPEPFSRVGGFAGDFS